ncbi:hypothetical protein NW763_014766 [Fusarium oxysporum]|nr:hypothetical protein NW763_014766 [Fusarium oxysporum]
MDAVADSIVANPENLDHQDSSTLMQALIREVRDETMKQMVKGQQETVKEIATSHQRIIETLWNAWKEEQLALKQMIKGQEKGVRQLQ